VNVNLGDTRFKTLRTSMEIAAHLASDHEATHMMRQAAPGAPATAEDRLLLGWTDQREFLRLIVRYAQHRPHWHSSFWFDDEADLSMYGRVYNSR
jgi:hypothetical protein